MNCPNCNMPLAQPESEEPRCVNNNCCLSWVNLSVSTWQAIAAAQQATRSQALQEVAQAVAHKALEAGYQKALEDFRALVKKKTQWSAWNVLCTVENKHVPEDWGWRDELSALAAQPAAAKTVQAQRDERRIGWEDVLGWFETWEPLINPTVADVETVMKEAVKDARRYFSQPKPAATPACPNCGVAGKMSGPGTTALCMACGYTETTSPGAEPEGLMS